MNRILIIINMTYIFIDDYMESLQRFTDRSNIINKNHINKCIAREQRTRITGVKGVVMHPK